jgi:hypothetical protein
VQLLVVVFGHPDVLAVITNSAQISETGFIAMNGCELVSIAGQQVDSVGEDIDPPEIFAVPGEALATYVRRSAFADDAELLVQTIQKCRLPGILGVTPGARPITFAVPDQATNQLGRRICLEKLQGLCVVDGEHVLVLSAEVRAVTVADVLGSVPRDSPDGKWLVVHWLLDRHVREFPF